MLQVRKNFGEMVTATKKRSNVRVVPIEAKWLFLALQGLAREDVSVKAGIDLPDDAELVGVRCHEEVVELLVRSESFADGGGDRICYSNPFRFEWAVQETPGE